MAYIDDLLKEVEEISEGMYETLNKIILDAIKTPFPFSESPKFTRPFSPEEKLRRLRNPLTLEDYGLSITEEELNSFPEGREFLKDFKRKYL